MIGVIGAGNVGQALILNWLRHGVYTPDELLFSTRQFKTGNSFLKFLQDWGYAGVEFTMDNRVLASRSDVIVLA
jgi:pyrroline-5-carboxylate reductase